MCSFVLYFRFPIEWAEDLNRPLSKKKKQKTQMTNRCMKRCPLLREMQVITTMRYHLTSDRMAIIKKSTNSKCWRGCTEKGTLFHCCWKCKLVQSRLADFFTNCQPESRSVSSCLKENYADCLLAYSGLIGTVMTPNYIDSSSLSVAPWCDCNNSGNDLEECLKFLNFFKDNTCLKNAIQAFGNGSDVTVWQPALPVQTTTATTTTAFRVKNKPLGPAGSENEIPTHVLPPCANLQRDYEKDGLAGASSHITTKSMAAPPSCGLSPLLALVVTALSTLLSLSLAEAS
ncbi:hypothetical protein FD755_004522 [Muntiacus reevesi]|uniref:GDNF/GAS1 domain-containing protein n=1 Tax=Muntiacus reevesi TaxID=9886 RepID=A0A5J5MR61_MUNRE|nr:hypothetical protein FD755_004522 [Muntiacus reevesi]